MSEQPILIGFTNRDTGCQEWIRFDHIVRIAECQHPEHKGFALLSVEVGLESVLIEADCSPIEFVKRIEDIIG